MDLVFDKALPLKLRNAYTIETGPSLLRDDVGPDETDVAQSIEDNLSDIGRAGKSVIVAIALFQFSETQQSDGRDLFKDWCLVAGREGAMALRNYATALANVRGLIGRVVAWRTKVDTASLKVIEKAFNNQFPFAHKMRHSVAHPEIYSDPEQIMGVTGAIDAAGILVEAGSAGTVVIRNHLVNGEFAATFEGVLVSYALSSENAALIKGLTESAFLAFETIDRWKQLDKRLSW